VNFPGMMLANAEGQLGDQQYAAAILLAQAAVEMLAVDAFTTLIGQRLIIPVNPVLDLVPDFSFMDKRTRDFWLTLTGDKITEPKDVWKPYHEHVERRNRVAHGVEWGDRNGGKDARGSVAAARAFMERIDATMQRLAQ
jgi:hypothetical protein